MSDPTSPTPAAVPAAPTAPDAATSPTGVAIVPAKVVPYLLGALAVLGVLIGLGAGTSPTIPRLVPAEPYLQGLASILTVLLGLTPGLRKLAMILLLPAATSLSGCAWWQRTEPKLVDCAEQTLASSLPDVVVEVGAAINNPDGVNWQADLEQLALKRGFDLVACALGVVISSIESGGGGAGAGSQTPSVASSVRLVRAYSYLETHPARLKR